MHEQVSQKDLEEMCEERKKAKEKEREEVLDEEVKQLRDSIVDKLKDAGVDTTITEDSVRRLEERVVDLAKKRTEHPQFPNYDETTANKQLKQTYQTLDNYLENGGNPNIVDNTLLHIGDPTTIDQGPNPTCNFCQVEKQIAVLAPQTYADIVTQVSATGQYNGVTIPKSWWQTLSGHGESYFTVANARTDGQRSPVSKIVTATTRYVDNSSNAHFNDRASFSEVQSIARRFTGEPVRYVNDYRGNYVQAANDLKSGVAPYMAMVTQDGKHAFGLYATPNGGFISDDQHGNDFLEREVAITPMNIAMAESLRPEGYGAFRGPLDAINSFFGGNNFFASLLNGWGSNGYNGFPAANPYQQANLQNQDNFAETKSIDNISKNTKDKVVDDFLKETKSEKKAAKKNNKQRKKDSKDVNGFFEKDSVTRAGSEDRQGNAADSRTIRTQPGRSVRDLAVPIDDNSSPNPVPSETSDFEF